MAARAWPSVSVVVPTRGRSAPAARAIECVLDQRYEGEVECVVVVDGASPPPDAPSPAAPPGARNVVFLRTPGANAAAARNVGARAASGELLAFCDDDDAWLPDKLRVQVERLLASRCAAATCGINVCYGERVIPRVAAKDVVAFDDLLRSRLPELHMSTILVAKADFLSSDRIGCFDEHIPGSYAEDHDWLLRAARFGGVLAVREPLVDVHWRGDSYFEGRWETSVSAWQYLLVKYPEFRRDRVGSSRLYGQIAFGYAALGRARESRRWVRRSLAANWRQPRAYLALLTGLGLVRPEFLLRGLHLAGKGI